MGRANLWDLEDGVGDIAVFEYLKRFPESVILRPAPAVDSSKVTDSTKKDRLH